MKENSLLNFCVGVSVGGHDGTNFSHTIKGKDFDMNKLFFVGFL